MQPPTDPNILRAGNAGTEEFEGFMSDLQSAGVELWLQAGQLRYRAPKGKLRPELIAGMQRYRDRIIGAVAPRLAQTEELPPLMPRARTNRAPLSCAQEGWWMQEQSGTPGVRLNFALLIEGPLQHRFLQQAFAQIVQRHESLRTCFRMENGQPTQVIGKGDDFRLEFVDLTHFAEAAVLEEARSLARERLQRPLNLETGPLFAVCLMCLREHRHVLLVIAHHIVGDATSLELLRREIKILYAAAASGKASPLQPLPIQYADFSIWEQSWLNGETLKRHRAYWRERLLGASPVRLPQTARTTSSASLGRQRTELDLASDETLLQLREIARVRSGTLYIAIVAALNFAFSRWAGQQDITLGMVTSGRTLPQMARLIGVFSRGFRLRVNLSADPTYSQLVKHVFEASLQAELHYGGMPRIFDVQTGVPNVLVNYLPTLQLPPENELSEPDGGTSDLTTEPFNFLSSSQGNNPFDLLMMLREKAGGLHCLVEFNAQRLSVTGVREIGAVIESILLAVVDNPNIRLSEIPVGHATRAPEVAPTA